MNRIYKMKSLSLILTLLFTGSLFSQTTFKVDNFSKQYYGKMFIADTSEVFSPGWIAIYDQKTNKQLIKVKSEELTFSLHNGKVLANIKELPYGEQSQILYEDYNFDGIKDFAIMDGQFSCYHGPSFKIYLATNSGFQYNADFTRLAQEYCGMFQVDYKDKTISTMTKSGCCWHQFSEFKVRNNKPYPIKIVEEGMDPSGILWDFTEQKWTNGKMEQTKYQVLDEELTDDKVLLSFEFENNKKMKILNSGSLLYYVFTDANNKIELLYHDIFTYSKAENCLKFVNHKTEYTIYDTKIVIKTANKTYEMKAANNTKSGTLAILKKQEVNNVIL